MELINDSWRTYIERCVPPQAGDVQISETRRAFFAGAATVYGIIRALEVESAMTDNAKMTLTALNNELSAFRDRIGKEF